MSTKNSSNILDNKIKDIELSKNAINFLSKQFVLECEKIIIEEKFIFQIVYALKKSQNYYICSIIDKDTKFDGFFINYDDQSIEPKSGDIIETKSVQIVKLPNRSDYIYFCDKVKKIKESVELININLENINNKKNNENIINISDNNINCDDKYSTPSKKPSNINNPELIESKKKYTLFSDLLKKKDIENPVFYLKCRNKTNIRDFQSKSEKMDGKIQFYYFLDTEGEAIKITAFSMININYYNSLIQPGCVYEISNLNIQKNKEEYTEIFPFQFIFDKYHTKVIMLKDKGDFNKIRIIYEKIITKISDLNSNKLNTTLNVLGIVLENRGISELNKTKHRNLIIGDNSLHRINLQLWSNRTNPDRVFLKGDIIYMTDLVYKENYIFNFLTSSKNTNVFHCQTSPIEQELRKLYKVHPNTYEYKDMNVNYLNSKKDIKFKFISQLNKKAKKENENNSKYEIDKIFGTIINFEHKIGNVKIKCNSCDKIVEDDHFYYCEGIPKLQFTIKIQIKDCSGNLYTDLFGRNAEIFLNITPEEYIKIINDNNEEKLNEINRRILYKNYIFYGKYITINNDSYSGFSVFKFDEVNGKLYRDLIKKISYNLE